MTKSRTPLVLLGAGGHCRSCIDVIEMTESFRITAIVGSPTQVGQSLLGYPIEHSDDDLPKLVSPETRFVVTVGQILSNESRLRLFQTVQEMGGQFATIVSPTARVSRFASIGLGSIVMHFALVNANAHVGENCIINSRALVEHDSRIGNHCHISTGAIINGSTTVGDHCFVGSGAVLRESIEIPPETIIPAATWIDGKRAPRSTRR